MLSLKKNPLVMALIALLVVIHIVIGIGLLVGGSEGDGVENKQEAVTPPVAPTTEEKVPGTPPAAPKPQLASGSGQISVPPAAPRGSQPGRNSRAYYNGYYRTVALDLPAKVRQLAAQCRSGLVLDMDSNTILWSKDADKVYPIASITKLMTALMLVEKAEADPSVSLSGTKVKITRDDFAVTKRIRKVYLDVNEEYTLDEYLKCMMIASANDCAYIVAKYLAGGDAGKFPAMMNARARELGLTGMTFHNAHGLPIDQGGKRIENQGTALEVAYLSQLAAAKPAIMKWAGTSRDCIRENANRFDLNSTNRLLRDRVPGVTGLKTGYTTTAGYCIVVTCQRDGRNIMVIVMGAMQSDTGKQRNAIARALLDWAYTVKL
jgi:D-alanyl-D-alanine carboxypeptidase (penicillin-binding protein 5/6)